MQYVYEGTKRRDTLPIVIGLVYAVQERRSTRVNRDGYVARYEKEPRS